MSVQFSSVTQLCLTLCDPMDCSTPGLPVHHSRSLLKLMSIESVMPSNHLILCHPILLPPSIFPSIRVFSNESVLRIRWLQQPLSTSLFMVQSLQAETLYVSEAQCHGATVMLCKHSSLISAAPIKHKEKKYSLINKTVKRIAKAVLHSKSLLQLLKIDCFLLYKG